MVQPLLIMKQGHKLISLKFSIHHHNTVWTINNKVPLAFQCHSFYGIICWHVLCVCVCVCVCERERERETTKSFLQDLRFEYVMTQCHLLTLRLLLRLVVGLILTTSHWWWLTQLLVHGTDRRVVEQTMPPVLQLQLLRATLHTAFSLSIHATQTQAFGEYTLCVIHWSVRWGKICSCPSISVKPWICVVICPVSQHITDVGYSTE
jgi:hypothetical protein